MWKKIHHSSTKLVSFFRKLHTTWNLSKKMLWIFHIMSWFIVWYLRLYQIGKISKKFVEEWMHLLKYTQKIWKKNSYKPKIIIFENVCFESFNPDNTIVKSELFSSWIFSSNNNAMKIYYPIMNNYRKIYSAMPRAWLADILMYVHLMNGVHVTS